MRVNRSAEAGLDQQRQAAGMVEVGMGQDYGIYRGRIERERLTVARLVGGSALNQPAIDEQLSIATANR